MTLQEVELLQDINKDMENIIEKSLSLMNRMGLFENAPKLRKTFKYNCDILKEGVFQSYNAEDIFRIMSKNFNIGSAQYFLENGNELGIEFDRYIDKNNNISNEISVISLVIPNDFKQLDYICNLFKTSNWTLAEVSPFEKNNNFTVYTFEKNIQKGVINLRPNEKLYHITPSSKLNKIIKNGLTPHAGCKLGDHVERIYLFPIENITLMDKINFQIVADELWKQKVRKEGIYLHKKLLVELIKVEMKVIP